MRTRYALVVRDDLVGRDKHGGEDKLAGADGTFMNLRMPFVGCRHVEVVRAARCGRTVRTRYALVVRDGLVGRDDENGGDDDGCDTNASEM